MPLGRIYTSLSLKYKHGLKTAYYRDVTRKRILETQSLTNNDDLTCEIHVLTSSQDFVNLFWTLKTFYFYSERNYALCIHDDGSLTDEHYSLFKNHFPDSRMIAKMKADQEVLASLANYPNCLKFRQSNHLAPKVFDFRYYLKSEKMLLLDSDVLFFKAPTKLLNLIESKDYRLNTVNADVKTSYTVSRSEVQAKLNIDLLDRFNSGLGLIHKASLNLDWLEEFLKLPGIIGHFWRIEQTLFALSSAKFGVELLPDEYNVFVNGRRDDVPSRHYVGEIRHLMYKEGIRKLLNQGFLKAIA